MSSKLLYITIGLLFCSHLLPVAHSYPTINLRRLFDSTIEARLKKSEPAIPPADEDVLELEHLKHVKAPQESDESTKLSEEDSSASDTSEVEVEAITSKPSAGPKEQEEPTQTQHRPPTLPHNSGGQNFNNAPNAGNAAPAQEEKPTKPYYGAARLAFGQHPEVHSTASTSSTASTPGAATDPLELATLAPPQPSEINSSPPVANQPEPEANNPSTTASSNPQQHQEGNPEVEDPVVAELEAARTEVRRSVNVMSPKTAETLLKHKDGQYSAFDLAQYVFWTGDETGVAKAVEEFIQRGLMTREHAIQFLREIRAGIEYLQSSYANRVFPNELKNVNDKKDSHDVLDKSTSTTTRVPPTTHALKPEATIERVPDLERPHLEKDKNTITDDATGRAKVAEFLYDEYSLEEVIYQLSKVMFTQSLKHGSDQAQLSLQKLTTFLENEGERGLISPALQKKILDSLLSALSDTLSEHPELLAAARANLKSSFHKLPTNSIDAMKH